MISGSEAPMYTHKLVQISPDMKWVRSLSLMAMDRGWCCWKAVIKPILLFPLQDMKFKCSVTLETDKAWGTMPLCGIYLRLQPWLKVGFFRFFSYFPNFILPRFTLLRVSQWLAKINRQTGRIPCYTPLCKSWSYRQLFLWPYIGFWHCGPCGTN